MADALLNLEHVIRSKREQLSLGEANLLKACMIRAKMDLYLGIGGGSVATWLATKKLRNPLRGALTVGAGLTCGAWLSLRSLESSVDHILSLEGSRIQRELANLMLARRHDDPWVQRRLSKHFYSEQVYNDSSADRPMLRWRSKNYSEDVAHSQGASYSEKSNPKENNMKKTAKMDPKQVYAGVAAYVRAADESIENPFDLIFGRAETESADDTQSDTPTEPSRRQMRKEKRSRRRRRRHHHEESEE